ncbi:hypothetical protein T06_16396 [Trichinella sp. T6]|nr:hypothetical protein T06_16396 [Trichinella sp. T6]
MKFSFRSFVILLTNKMILLLLLSLTASVQCNGAKASCLKTACILKYYYKTNESEIEDKSEFEVKFAFCSFKVCEKELSKVEKPNLTEQEAKTYYESYIICRDECFERISTSEAFAKKFEKFKLKEYEKLMKKRKEKEEKREEKRRKEAEKRKKQMEKEEEKKEKQQKEPTVCEKELSKVEKPNLTEQEAKTYYESYIICRDECFERISASEAFAKKFEKFKLKEYEKLMKKRKEKEEKREEKRRKEAEKRKKQMEREEKKKEKQQKEPTEFEVKFAFCSFKVCEKELSKVEKPNLTEQEAKTYYESYIICRDECFERISASEAFAKKFEKFKLKEYEKLMKKRKEKEEKREEKRRKEAEKIKKQMEREEEKK